MSNAESQPKYIAGAVMQYSWGRVGHESAVATLAYENTPNLVDIRSNKPFAELWFGTHPNGVNYVLPTQNTSGVAKHDKSVATLSDLTRLQDMVDGELSFLLKVLSINSALSLQAHPNKTLAQELHKNDPKNYRDPNHKPELVIALTNMSVLCGFRPISQIGYFLKHVPEFSMLVPISGPLLLDFLDKHNLHYDTDTDKTTTSSSISSFPASSSLLHTDKTLQPFPFEALSIPENRIDTKLTEIEMKEAELLLQQVFDEAMRCDKDTVNISICSFVQRHQDSIDKDLLTSLKQSTQSSKDVYFSILPGCSLVELVCSLAYQYPADVGVLCPLFLNYFSLLPFESIFLGPGIAHAYLSGQCIEAMACSDNVLRAGLTPKFRDIKALCDMLSYSMTPPYVNTGCPLPGQDEKDNDRGEGDHDKNSNTVIPTMNRSCLYAPPLEFPEFMVISTVFTPMDIQLSRMHVKSYIETMMTTSEITPVIQNNYDIFNILSIPFEILPSLDSPSFLLSVSGDILLLINNEWYQLSRGNTLFIPQNVIAYATPYLPQLSRYIKNMRKSMNNNTNNDNDTKHCEAKQSEIEITCDTTPIIASVPVFTHIEGHQSVDNIELIGEDTCTMTRIPSSREFVTKEIQLFRCARNQKL